MRLWRSPIPQAFARPCLTSQPLARAVSCAPARSPVIHGNYPAQFRHLAVLLGRDPAHRVTYGLLLRLVLTRIDPERARIFSSNQYNASQMVSILRSLELLLTSRYHACVLSLAAQVPQIAIGHDLRLKTIYRELGLFEDFFVEPTRFGNSILRPIHYPPITSPDIPNVRAGAHEDINLITLLVGASAAGLEVLSRKGEWVPFTADGDTIVVNIGDMLQRLSNHVYPSTTHRVVNPPGDAARQPRYSTPYFLHANPDYLIQTLPQCVSADNPDRYPEPITANDYLMQRLREIKLF